MAEPKGAAPVKKPSGTPSGKAAAAKASTKPRVKGAPKAAKPAATAPGAGASPHIDPYAIVIHPVVTEKTMFNMDKNNALEFLVRVTASKPQIKAAVEQLFTVKVAKVTTRIARDGKRAIVRFAEGYSAEDVGTRIGVF